MQEEIEYWQHDLEWEQIDGTPDMVLGDPILEQQQKLREERRMIEEADHKLTEELFNENFNNYIKDNDVIIAYKKIKSSGKILVDNIIKNTKKIKNITIKKPNMRKVYNEFVLNNIDDTSTAIEDKYYNNKRRY